MMMMMCMTHLRLGCAAFDQGKGRGDKRQTGPVLERTTFGFGTVESPARMAQGTRDPSRRHL